MLRPSGTNLSGYCARSRDWRERERARTRASEQPGSQRRRRGRWGEGAGERGGQPCPRGLVLWVLRGSLPEGVRKVPPPPHPARKRRPSCAAERPGGRQGRRRAAGCAHERRHFLPSTASARPGPADEPLAGAPCNPRSLLGHASAPPGRSPRSVAKSERVSFSRISSRCTAPGAPQRALRAWLSGCSGG